MYSAVNPVGFDKLRVTQLNRGKEEELTQRTPRAQMEKGR